MESRKFIVMKDSIDSRQRQCNDENRTVMIKKMKLWGRSTVGRGELQRCTDDNEYIDDYAKLRTDSAKYNDIWLRFKTNMLQENSHEASLRLHDQCLYTSGHANGTIHTNVCTVDVKSKDVHYYSEK